MGTITTIFEEVKMRREIKVRCPECQKVRPKVLVESYYLNGLHVESETRAKKERLLTQQQTKLMAEGLICNACATKNDPKPFLFTDLRVGDRVFYSFSGYAGQITELTTDDGQRRATFTRPRAIYHPFTDEFLRSTQERVGHRFDRVIDVKQYRVWRGGEWLLGEEQPNDMVPRTVQLNEARTAGTVKQDTEDL